MYKREKVFLIPYEYCFKDYKDAVTNNNISNLTRVFYDIERVDVKKKSCKLSRKEIVDIIKSEKNNIIENFSVEKLYLFGSYAKRKNTNRSDVDIIVIFKDGLINMEKKKASKN